MPQVEAWAVKAPDGSIITNTKWDETTARMVAGALALEVLRICEVVRVRIEEVEG